MILKDFINDGWDAQQNYAESSGIAGPYDLISNSDRYQAILNNIGHMIEEVVEARREVKRRPWKKNETGCLDDQLKREAFVEEMFDVLLFFRATLAYAQVSGEEFERIAQKKLNFNESRPDHKIN